MTVNRELLREAIGYMAFKAKGSTGESFSIRVAERDDGKTLYLDLADPAGRVVKVTEETWAVIADAPVRFVRPPGTLPLPVPVRGGSVQLLRDLMPVDDDQWTLILGWLLGALREHGAHFAAVFQGPGGTAKSTLAAVMSLVVDPRNPTMLQMNNMSEDLLLSAHSRWVLALDEVKPLTLDKASTLKAITTGTGYSARKKYSDGDVYACEVLRPIVLTGHCGLLDDPALLSRSIPLWRRAPVPSDKDMKPTAVEARLQERLPQILGALLDMVVNGLKEREPRYPRNRQPRMSDAFEWIARCLQGSGLDPVRFLDALDEARTGGGRRAPQPVAPDRPAGDHR